MDTPSSVFTKNNLTLPLLFSLLTLILYLITLSPTINFGDSPELVSSAYTLGMSHPPGYPLYSLMGKLFSLIPWSGSVAERVNFASALYTAASIFILALVIRMSDLKYTGIGIGFFAVFLALSPTLWSQSVISEVYALNLLCFSLLIFLTFLFWKKGDRRYLMTGVFLYGIGLANHHTLLPFIPLLIIFLIAGKRRNILNIRSSAFLFSLFILGMSVYIFMPLRSAQNPPMDWGDPQTLGNFLDVLLRSQFPTIEAKLTMGQALAQLTYYGKAMVRELTLVGALLSMWGLIRSYKLGTAPFLFLLTLFLVHGTGTLLVLNPTTAESYENVDAMMIPSFTIGAIWIGLALSDLSTMAAKRKPAIAAVAVLFALLLGALIDRAPSIFHKKSEKNNFFALDYATNIFTSMDKNGVIFVESDTALFPLWYLQFVEGLRPDVAVMDVDFLMLPWFKGQIRERYKNIEINVEDLSAHSTGGGRKVAFADMLDAFKVRQMESIIENLITTRPVYISYEFGPVYRQFRELKGVYVINEGLIFRVSRMYRKPDVEKWDDFNLRSLLRYEIKDDPFTKVLATAYINPLKRKGQILFSNGKREEAMSILKRIRKIEADAAKVEG